MSTVAPTGELRRVFLGLGSNVGDRLRFLADAIVSLVGVVAVCPVYETDPVGGPSQEPFLNVVVELETSLSPRELLGIAHRLESAAGTGLGRALGSPHAGRRHPPRGRHLRSTSPT